MTDLEAFDLERLRKVTDRLGAHSSLIEFTIAKKALAAYLHLMEGAETVEWCLEHKALRCCEAHTDCTKNEDIAYNPTACRMVKADLHVRSESVEA